MPIRPTLITLCGFAILLVSNAALRSLHAQVKTYELAGLVADASRTPIAGAEVTVLRDGTKLQQAVSAQNGRFAVTDLPAGVFSIRVRRLGYQAGNLQVVMGTQPVTAIDVLLKDVATELEDVYVNANDASRLREFNEHKGQRTSFAKFYDQGEIRRQSVMFASDLFRTMPGITIKASPIGGNTVRIRDCQPMVWLDGQRVPMAELDEVAAPGDIAGIEFYSSMAGTPAQYLERTNRACGTILVWTKNR